MGLEEGVKLEYLLNIANGFCTLFYYLLILMERNLFAKLLPLLSFYSFHIVLLLAFIRCLYSHRLLRPLL